MIGWLYLVPKSHENVSPLKTGSWCVQFSCVLHRGRTVHIFGEQMNDGAHGVTDFQGEMGLCRDWRRNQVACTEKREKRKSRDCWAPG